MGTATSSPARGSSGSRKAKNTKKGEPCGGGGRIEKATPTTKTTAPIKVEESSSSNFELLDAPKIFDDEVPVAMISESEDDDLTVDSEEEDTEDEDSDDDEDFEEDDDFEERLAILAECKKLKFFAQAYLHPEETVKTSDPAACGRNYFERQSAPDVVPDDEARERSLVLADAAALKNAAVDYLHPEMGVVTTDPAACGRNYYERLSAAEESTKEAAEVRAEILADAAALKKLASDYVHPEHGVNTSDPAACGRNYFGRPSAPTKIEEDADADERAQILANAAAMKKLAADYMHPEIGVETTDATAFGRNYFDRPAAIEETSDEDSAARAEILADAAALKKLACDYAHPEHAVKTSDPSACGRNYFGRVSAPSQILDNIDAEERAGVLADAAAMKKLAVDYAHPEVGVKTSDATIFGRNYFERPSVIEEITDEQASVRAEILADAAALKKLAGDYLHPECGVKTSDPTSFGRNYFDKVSSPDQATNEDAEARAQILADAAALKKISLDYVHPENGVKTSDPSACGRCYFDRASAPDVTDEEERTEILEDAVALKKFAADYAHPELGVKTTDPAAYGRSYFDRASAPRDMDEEQDERTKILADAAAMKKLAVDYAHPEIGVKMTDPAVFGRNYFERPSAHGKSSEDDAEACRQIVADAAAMKKLAVDYMHPEIGVRTSDPTACGRSYFGRPSAPEQTTEDYADSRAQILADAVALKKLAADHEHPEVGVKMSDSTACGRNFFSRPSAAEEITEDEAEERAQILADAAAMKKLAVDYIHPEIGVKMSDPASFARNFFQRPSAPEEISRDNSSEKNQILADAEIARKLASAYMHPEIGVKESSSTAFGRNYYGRPSAPAEISVEDAEDRAQVLADAASMRKHATDYMHPECGVETIDPAVYGRNYFTRVSAPTQFTEDDAAERALVLADAASMKKLAKDYLHPEIGVETTDASAFGRNYFYRPSAAGQGGVLSMNNEMWEPDHAAEECDDYFEMDLEEDVLYDMRTNLAHVVPRPPTPTDAFESQIIDEEEEGNLSRSPSSVMLFDMAEGNLSRKASAVKLSSMGDGNSNSPVPFLEGLDSSNAK